MTEAPEPKRRRPKGDGHLLLRVDGKWIGAHQARKVKGGVWYACYVHDNKKVRESPMREYHTGSRQAAADLLRKRLREIRDGVFVPGAARVTLGHLRDLVLADYEQNGRTSIDDVKGRFKNLVRILGEGVTVNKIRPKVPNYIASRLKEKRPSRKKLKEGEKPPESRPISPATVNRELAMLKHGFNLAVKAGILATMPRIDLLEEGPPRKGFPEPDEIQAIIGKLADRLQAPMRFLSITGWRVREALRLEWRSVDLKGGTLRLEADETKGGEIRVYPFGEHHELRAMIQAQRVAADAIEAERRSRGDITPVMHVFPKADGTPNLAYQHAWGRACRKAGYPGRLVHDLRRYAARSLVRAGVSETVAMNLLGHKTPSVFRRYNVTDERDLRAAVRHLAHAQAEREAAKQANA